MFKIAALFVTVIGAATGLTAYLLASNNENVVAIGKELGKLTAQAALVSVIGGGILQEYNRRRDLAQDSRERRTRLIDTLVEAYAGAKRSRRLLRAKCRVPAGDATDRDRLQVARVAYEEQMGSINDTQLSLETLLHELMTFPRTFKYQDDVRKSIARMENYLGTLVTEYEMGLRGCDDAAPVSLSEMPRLADFVHAKRDSFFRKNFTYSFRVAVAMMRGGDYPDDQLPAHLKSAPAAEPPVPEIAAGELGV